MEDLWEDRENRGVWFSAVLFFFCSAKFSNDDKPGVRAVFQSSHLEMTGDECEENVHKKKKKQSKQSRFENK